MCSSYFGQPTLVLVHCGVATAVGAGRDTREDRGLHRLFREWETARNMKTPVDHQYAESEGGDAYCRAVYPDSLALFDF
ncbi:hypothetical protein B0H14DRAFT_2905757 [Mycena olivaceomarginata]|nr:hypothetical protein B0H14DRAFT_2905757 [Mycena olivaceomarginata]